MASRRVKRIRRVGSRLQAEINVTPLVDVVLVLLVIFLIVSPILFRYAEVSLPGAKTAFAASGIEGHVTLTLQRGGRLFYEDRQITAATLPDELRKDLGVGGSLPVLIRADSSLKYGEVKRIMDICHLVGLGDIRLATADDEEGG